MATILCGIYIKFLWFSVGCQWAFFRNSQDFGDIFDITLSPHYALKEFPNIL